MNPARENILARVRTALRTPAYRPVAPEAGKTIWPPIANAEERFRSEYLAVKGELITDLPAFLAGFPKIASCVPDRVPGNADARVADLGVTGCECLVAQTGSIIVTSRAQGGRALSVLPPVHLVVASRQHLVPDLDTAVVLIRQRYAGNWPSALSVITGPSRTADIEKILVQGAHGPKRLALYFVD